MSLRSEERFKITLFTLGVAIFLWIGFLGLAYSTPSMQMDEQASNCPFMDVTALCAMNPLGHLVMWQEMFTASPQQNTLSLFILLVLLLSFVFARGLHLPRTGSHLLHNKLYFIQHFSFVPPLLATQEAFSKGILNSKAF